MWSSARNRRSSSASILLSWVTSSLSRSRSSWAWAAAVFSWSAISCFTSLCLLSMEAIRSPKILLQSSSAVSAQLCGNRSAFYHLKDSWAATNDSFFFFKTGNNVLIGISLSPKWRLHIASTVQNPKTLHLIRINNKVKQQSLVKS